MFLSLLFLLPLLACAQEGRYLFELKNALYYDWQNNLIPFCTAVQSTWLGTSCATPGFVSSNILLLAIEVDTNISLANIYVQGTLTNITTALVNDGFFTLGNLGSVKMITIREDLRWDIIGWTIAFIVALIIHALLFELNVVEYH